MANTTVACTNINLLKESQIPASPSQTELYAVELDGKPLTRTNISNCITEIPQDIKLELNNGTLTLKAGSKVYVPNGAGVFDTVTISSDKTVETSGQTGSLFVITRQDGSIVHGNQLVSSTASGTTPGTGLYYKTDINEINIYNSGVFQDGKFSLPLAIITVSSGTVTSIDQVFNGFGYIGSTVFALPGVKGLIPNGRNADGSLKNIEYTVPSVVTYTANFNEKGRFLLSTSNELFWVAVEREYYVQETQPFTPSQNVYGNWYNPLTNEIKKSWNGEPWIKVDWFDLFKVDGASGKITSFTPKTVFHALDYNYLQGIRTVIKTYKNGDSWYRLYSDGWVEQGGRLSVSASANTPTRWETYFLKTMSGTTYYKNISFKSGWIYSTSGGIENETSGGMDGFFTTSNTQTVYIYWEVKGYSA